MTSLPKRIHIFEEGPREGFQIEKGPITTARKIELIDALSKTGLDHIQIVSFVDPTAGAGHGGRRGRGARHHARARRDLYRAVAERPRVRARGRDPAARHQGHDRAVRLGDVPQAQPEPHQRRAARRAGGPGAALPGARLRGRARHHHGGLRLQFRRRCSAGADRRDHRSDARHGGAARRHARLCVARRHHGLGDAGIDQARGRRRARAVSRARAGAAPARHPRHGNRQRLCGHRDGHHALRCRGRRPGRLSVRRPRGARPATSAPRTWSSCATRWASRPASISRR